ncbi:hypothetical protein CBS101457_003340 [Exobasidium rhododendri]|nr:hypothetical protein CBS101457_003340 [Exobasidium rhododendri]
MSFSWKGLLGVGGSGGPSNSAGSSGSALPAGQHNSNDPFADINGWDEKDFQWELEETDDQPNMLGMRNFGNTCYVNSVIQALYYCRPFRESLLAYTSSLQAPTITQGEGIKGQSFNSRLGSPPLLSKEVVIESQKQKNQIAEITFFNALQTLFSQMVTAKVLPTLAEPVMPSNPPASTSYLATGLSRKGTTKATVSNAKSSISASASMPSAMMPSGFPGALPTSLASTTGANKVINTCSNVVVEDDDIKQFLTTLKKSNILFDSTAHQDAHELLNFVLNRIGEDVVEDGKARQDSIKVCGNKREPEVSPVSVMDVDKGSRTWVHRVFEGTLTNETRCLTCETVTSRDESFLDLSIDIERNSSVTSCLRQFSASEMLCARNKFFCDTCSGLQEAEKRMKVKRLPNVLALHLKRFKYEESVQRYVKLAYRVVFPFELRLFNTSDDAKDPDKLYELFAIIVHIGMGPHHGHYIAIVKVGSRWFVFDDETINIIDEADICRYFGDTPGAGSAYVLFYQAVELNLQSLGLVDTRAEKQRAKEMMERDIWEQYSARRMAFPANGVDGAGAKDDTRKVPPVFVASPTPIAPTSSDAFASDLKSSNMAASLSSSGLPSSTSTSAFFKRGGQNTLPNLPASQASAHDQQQEGKSSSWFSSLRPGNARKPSSMNFLSVGSPPTSTGASPPVPFRSSVVAPENIDDAETASTFSSSSSSRQAPISHYVPNADASQPSVGGVAATTSSYDGNATAPALLEPPYPIPASNHPSPIKSNGLSKSFWSSPQQQQQQQGASFAPADRALSKKEQDKIAKQSRRSSLTVAPTLPLHTSQVQVSPAPPSNVHQTHLGLGAPPLSNPMSAGDGQANGAAAVGRRLSIRRPTTADPHVEPSPVSRRRSTLSKTFGFGRKNDK